MIRKLKLKKNAIVTIIGCLILALIPVRAYSYVSAIDVNSDPRFMAPKDKGDGGNGGGDNGGDTGDTDPLSGGGRLSEDGDVEPETPPEPTEEEKALDRSAENEDQNKDSEKKSNAIDLGDPVNVATGEYSLSDFDIKEVKRNYTSGSAFTGSFGYGWYSTVDEVILVNSYEYYGHNNPMYSQCVEADYRNSLALKFGMPLYYYKTGSGKYTFVDDNGIPHLFVLSNGNKFVPAVNAQKEFISLEVRSDEYELLLKNGTRKIFNSKGLLSKIIDRNNNEISFLRNAEGHVSSVSTSFGEKYDFKYNENGLISEIVNVRNPEFKIIYEYKIDSVNGRKYLRSVTDDVGDTVVFDYSTAGKLSGIVKSDGSKIQIDYNTQLAGGKIVTTSTTNEEEFSESFSYEPSKRRTVYTDHDGNITEVIYDSNYKTIYQKSPDGTVINYSYDAAGNCIEQKTNGDVVTYVCDSHGNKTRASYSDGKSETWNYDEFSFVTEHVDRDGVVESFERDNCGNVTRYALGGKTVWTASYDSKGQMKSQTIFGGTQVNVLFDYDEYGNVIERKIGGRTESYSYDRANRITEFSVNGNVISKYSYDGKKVTKTDYTGMKTIYTVNGRKDLVSIEEYDDVTGEARITRTEYDKRHLPIKQFVGDGKTENLLWEKRYTPAGLLLAARVPDGNTSYILVNSYKGGNLVKQVRFAADGNVDNFQKTDLNLLQKSARDLYVQECKKEIGTGNKIAYTFTDEIKRNQIVKIDAFGNNYENQNPLGEIFTNRFTSGGKILSSENVFGGIYDFGYDESGFLNSFGEHGKEKIKIEYNNDGSISSSVNRFGEKTKYIYDDSGRTKSISSPDKTEWFSYDDFGRVSRYVIGAEDNQSNAERFITYTYSSDGKTVGILDGGFYKSTYEFNSFGEVVKRTDGNGNTTSFAYDEKGNCISMTDAYGNVARYEYNCFGLIVKSVDFDGAVKLYQYDAAMNLIKVFDDVGIVWQGEYDKAGRLVAEKGRPGIDKEYEYDNLDRITKVKTGGVVIESYSYSPYGREVIFTDGNGKDYKFYRDEFGRTVSEKNRLGKTQEFFYDAESRLKSKVDFNGNEIKIQYSDGGRTEKHIFTDGTESIIKYNMSGNVIYAKNEHSQYFYEYDKGGKLISVLDVIGGDKISYTYDRAGNRLSMKSNSSNIEYSYGKNGELKSINDKNQLTSVKFFYDKSGREIKRVFGNGNEKLTSYDKAGRAVLIIERNSRGVLLWGEGYVYDSLGRIAAKVTGDGAVTLYEYDEQGRLEKAYYPLMKELQGK